MIQIKEHIIESEMLTKKGAWKPKAKIIAQDADKVLKKFIANHAGELSLCSIQNILECSLNHQIMLARLITPKTK